MLSACSRDSGGSIRHLLKDFLVAGDLCTLMGLQGQGLVLACGSHSYSQCPLLGPKMVAVTPTCPGSPVGSVLLPGSTHRKRTSGGGPAPLFVHLPIMAPCLFGRSSILPSTPSVTTAQPLQAVYMSKFSLKIDLKNYDLCTTLHICYRPNVLVKKCNF